MEVITRAEAQERELKRYFTGRACARGHTTERLTSSGHCVGCKRINTSAIRTRRKKAASCRDCSRPALRETQYCIVCRARRRAYSALKARVKYLDMLDDEVDVEMIHQIYKDAHHFSAGFGVDFHVDHWIPLSRGGLHHPENLRILPASTNLEKGDKMPFTEWTPPTPVFEDDTRGEK